MKKYLLSFFAVVLAICMVSFAQPEKSNATEDLYWFQYNAGVVGSQIGSGAMSKTSATSQSCPDVAGVDCARGYASPTNPGSEDNPHLDQIQKSQ